MNINDLIEAFLNEKSTTALLKYKEDVISKFHHRLQLQKTFKFKIQDSIIIKNIYELEIDRIEYYLREYIMTRIEKLKRNLFIDVSLLSNNEKIFYEKYLNKLKEKGFVCENSCEDNVVVGFICKKDLGNVILDEEDVEMYSGDFFVGPLSDVYSLVLNGDICLI